METKPCLIQLEQFSQSSSICSDDHILQSINTIHNSTDKCLSNSIHSSNCCNELPDISNINLCNDNTTLHHDHHNHHIINPIYIKLLSQTTIDTINKLIINLGKIKIIAVQSCNSLRTTYYRNISKLKLINLLTLIQSEISIIKVDLETLVSESLLLTLTFDYVNIFSNISLKNYIEIIRIVDLTFYNLYSILRNIQECS